MATFAHEPDRRVVHASQPRGTMGVHRIVEGRVVAHRPESYDELVDVDGAAGTVTVPADG